MLLPEPRSTLHDNPWAVVLFSPDSAWMAVDSRGSRPTELHHLATGEVTRLELEPHSGLAFAPDSRRLAVTSPQGCELRDLQGHLLADSSTVPAGGGTWCEPSFSPDGSLLAMAVRAPRSGPDGSCLVAQLVDARNLRPVRELRHGRDWPSQPDLYTEWARFTPDGQELVWCGGDHTLRQTAAWETATGRQAAFLRASSRGGLVVAPTGRALFHVADRRLEFWRREPLGSWKPAELQPRPPGDLGLASDGQTVTALHDLPVEDETQATCTLTVVPAPEIRPLEMGMEGLWVSLAFNPTHSLAAVLTVAPTPTGWQNYLWLWALTSGRPLVQLPCRSQIQKGAEMLFSPDGRWLAVSSSSKVELWSVEALLA